jgi:hypothetical protein
MLNYSLINAKYLFPFARGVALQKFPQTGAGGTFVLVLCVVQTAH